MTRLVISGWYGKGNLGDELILESMLHELRSNFDDLSVTVLSDNPRLTASKHHVNALNRRGKLIAWLRRLTAISRADLFILGGGNLLMDWGVFDKNAVNWLKPMKLAQRLGKPTMTYAIGVGRIWTKRSKTVLPQVMKRTDAICVRDEKSASELAQLGIKGNVIVTADPALLICNSGSNQRSVKIEGNMLNVIFCVRQWYESSNKIKDEKLFAKLKLELSKFVAFLTQEKNATVTFVPFRVVEGDDDRKVAEEIAKQVPSPDRTTILQDVPSTEEILRILGNCDLLVGMRLHSLILAASNEVPMIAIDYHQKVGGFMHSILAEELLLSPAEVTFEKLKSILQEASKPDLAKRISERVELQREEARKNTQIAMSLILKRAESTSETETRIPVPLETED